MGRLKRHLGCRPGLSRGRITATVLAPKGRASSETAIGVCARVRLRSAARVLHDGEAITG